MGSILNHTLFFGPQRQPVKNLAVILQFSSVFSFYSWTRDTYSSYFVRHSMHSTWIYVS